MRHPLFLDYTLPTGRLTPYFDALAEGQALGAHCVRCARVHFPPGAGCADCADDNFDWVPLSGAAWVLHRTDAADASFAIVRFEGADNAALVRLKNPADTWAHARLVAPDAGPPCVWVVLTSELERHEHV